MQIACLPDDSRADCLKFLKAEVEKSDVVGLEAEKSVLLEKIFVKLKEGAVSKSSLGVSLLGQGSLKLRYTQSSE